MEELDKFAFNLSKDGDFIVSEDVQKTFDDYGFIIVRQLLNSEEVDKVNKVIEDTEWLKGESRKVSDEAGKKVNLTLWNSLTPGDVTGALASSQKTAGTMEKLLGGEVYHYHTKLSMKEPNVGGSFVWHQDYGYWYNNGCLVPDMGTVFIALDKCSPSNGCLQIIPKSHKCGRIKHVKVTDTQVGADLERVKQLQKRLGLLNVSLEPGDALFFHSNILHTSSQNRSPYRRYAFLCSYNRADNDPVYKHHHPNYVPLKILPNSSILESKAYISKDDKSIFSSGEEDFSVTRENELN